VFRVLPGPHKSYAHLTDTIRALNEAVLAQHSVKIRYRADAPARCRRARSTRTASGTAAAACTSVGHDHKSGELRTFAVERITPDRSHAQRFAVASDFDFERLQSDRVRRDHAEPATPVRILFDERWAS
jgi:predicted DNA-binding transcriptional regulator YafY